VIRSIKQVTTNIKDRVKAVHAKFFISMSHGQQSKKANASTYGMLHPWLFTITHRWPRKDSLLATTIGEFSSLQLVTQPLLVSATRASIRKGAT
jgi:hypothetical protein